MAKKEKLRSEIDDKYKWDLSLFIKDDKEFNKLLKKAKKGAENLLDYKGKITKDSETLYKFLKENDENESLLEDLCVYSGLAFDEDTSVDKNKVKREKAENLANDISEMHSFVMPELMKTSYKTIKKFIKENKKLKEYEFYLETLYRYEKYILSDKEEAIISKSTSVFGMPREAFSALNNTDIKLGTINDEKNKKVELTNSNYGIYMKSKNREVRKEAFEKMYSYWSNHINTLSATYKGNIKENFFMSKVKSFEDPLTMSLYNDNINTKLYTSLIDKTNENLDLMYEYMGLRKKSLGLSELHMYDIYVDLIKGDNKKYSFEECKTILFEALKPLGKTYLNDLQKAFDNRWIDIYPNKGKKSGAYKWCTYTSVPYVLLNYNETLDSVSTAAHELGHAMHSYYSNKNQGYIDSYYPIFLAEIASTVNEVLLNDYLVKSAKTNKERALFLNDMLDTIRTTFYRQVMFAEFEMLAHDGEKQGTPLTKDFLCNTYYELNKKHFGDNVVSDEEIKYEWARIPHLYTSFYVYKYATGLSIAIYFAKNLLEEKEGARENYLKFLSSGGKNYPLETLKEAGINLENSEAIIKIFDFFKEKLEELKKII